MVGPILNILIGLGLIIASGSGFVFKGTDSPQLLALLGVVVLGFGVFGLARRTRS